MVSHELLKGYNENLSDKYHVDAMAWFCNILGDAGNAEFKSTLEEVYKTSKNRKIRGYAKKNLKKLR